MYMHNIVLGLIMVAGNLYSYIVSLIRVTDQTYPYIALHLIIFTNCSQAY